MKRGPYKLYLTPEVPEHGNLSSETVDRTEVSYFHDLNFKRSSSNSWLYEDYDDESLLEEIWFDAEDSSLTDDFYVDYNNEHSQQKDEEKDASFDYNRPLCKCTTITQGEALMMTLALGVEESLTWKTIVGILSMINTLFENDVVPSSKYKLFKTLKLSEDILAYHVYCRDCHHYFGSQDKFNKNGLQCPICDNSEKSPDISYFLTFDISLQLKSILEDPKFIPICAVVDSVARCKILNMKQYNGSYGCTFCEHPGLRMNNSQKFPITTVVPKERTNESVKEQMLLAGESEFGSDVMGVWGPSALINLNYYDIVDGMSPDYMHAILLGVIKQHTEILLSSFGEDYYVGSPNQLEAINIKLLNFKHPTCITRSPRNLTEREMWKATEWRSWLLFYSLICLKDILPQKYLEHLALLVEAINQFSQFCERNLTGRLKNTFEVDGCILIGKGTNYNLNDNERKLVNRSETCKSFNRFIYNGKRYTSKNYRACAKTNDSIISLENGKIGIIKNVCLFNSDKGEKKIYIFFEEVVRLKKYFHSSRYVTVNNIEECLITEELNICEAKMISQPCMLTPVKNKHYVIFIPPGCYEVIKAAREKVNCSNCADRLEITKKLIEITDNLVKTAHTKVSCSHCVDKLHLIDDLLKTAYTKVSCLNCVDNLNLNQKLLEITQKFQKLELRFV
ncbi:Protein of unknown function [Cotesia congregata]|uniref:Uncharacterized protein n=1 Tax=Cotesia congregata TaxID=51543 RepID=A0A8J2HKR1_COTCN|nr:Protein of unknown function [Cotesia congregata]